MDGAMLTIKASLTGAGWAMKYTRILVLASASYGSTRLQNLSKMSAAKPTIVRIAVLK